MVLTKNYQKVARSRLDEKLAVSAPSRETLENLAVQCASNPSPDNTFQYAFCLAKSSERSELSYALKILDNLVSSGYEHELDCMYASATACYLLTDFMEARSRCEAMLRAHADHPGALELHLASIDAGEEQENRRVKKIALGGTTAIAAIGLVAGIAGMLLSKK